MRVWNNTGRIIGVVDWIGLPHPVVLQWWTGRMSASMMCSRNRERRAWLPKMSSRFDRWGLGRTSKRALPEYTYYLFWLALPWQRFRIRHYGSVLSAAVCLSQSLAQTKVDSLPFAFGDPNPDVDFPTTLACFKP
jgi:hypothetical protein